MPNPQETGGPREFKGQVGSRFFKGSGGVGGGTPTGCWGGVGRRCGMWSRQRVDGGCQGVEYGV